MAPALLRRAPVSPLAALALGFLLAAALSACGGTLYDAAGVPVVSTGGAHCDPGTHLCGAACVSDSAVATCGDRCAPCQDVAGATATCEAPSGGAFACGYACPEGQLACPSGCCHPTAVAAGGAHACAVTDAQSLVCWGLNDRGQVGPAGGGAAVPRPVQVFPDGVTAVSAGAHHTCAVRAGAVTCWGANDGGQLGAGSTGSGGPTPVVTTGLSGVAALALGTAHSCALTSAGAVRCWGANAAGQQGAGDTAAAPARKSTPVTSGATLLSAGGDTTCAVAGGGPICWGADARGQAGAGGTSRTPRTTPGPVAGVPAGAPLSLAVGGLHACASYGGSTGLWCWGADDEGQLGTGATGPDAPSAIQASKVDNKARSVAVLAGAGHTCSAKDALELTCAGRNDQQQGGAPASATLLDGPPVSFGANLLVAGGPASAASAGGDFTCVLVGSTGAAGVKCWGGNGSGQLGRGTAGGSAATAEYVSSKR